MEQQIRLNVITVEIAQRFWVNCKKNSNEKIKVTQIVHKNTHLQKGENRLQNCDLWHEAKYRFKEFFNLCSLQMFLQKVVQNRRTNNCIFDKKAS